MALCCPTLFIDHIGYSTLCTAPNFLDDISQAIRILVAFVLQKNNIYSNNNNVNKP